MNQSDLFEHNNKIPEHKPLAALLRPQSLNEYVGQDEVVGKTGPVRKMIESENLYSMIFWGPPGTGKTTLAHIIAHETNARFVSLSAVSSGKKDVERVVHGASEALRMLHKKTIFFLDEIHRFNKAQQDFLLPYVEEGIITLIGATTENPSFEVNGALLSRCRVFTFKTHSRDDLQKVLARVIVFLKKERKVSVTLEKEADELLIDKSNGDPRTLINAIEMSVGIAGKVLKHQEKVKMIKITKKTLKQVFQTASILYDKNGEEHCNVISAFIKSMRASDPDAAIYWLARMIEAGEDPKFIARRCIILASEDVGNAAPTALVLANAAFEAVNKVGWPESRIILAQLVIYLAKAPKDNTAVTAITKAQEDARNTLNLPVPMHLRNAPTKFMKKQGYGKNYVYDHDIPNKKSGQQCLPDELKDKKYVKVDQ